MWSDVMIIMLRYMINDYSSPQTYSDNQLKNIILVNAIFVAQELNFSQNFSIDLMKLTITPDPITEAPDYNFVNLTVLRAAVNVVMNEYKVSTTQSIMFREFHTQVDMREVSKNKKAMWDGLQELYDEKRMQYQVGIRVSAQAILSPINIIGSWRGPVFFYSDRDGYR